MVGARPNRLNYLGGNRTPRRARVTRPRPLARGRAVSQTGTGTISLSFNSNMYPPNSTGGNAFETAVFKGDFSLSARAA